MRYLVPHLRYLIYILRHKWFVFRGGLIFKVPLWQLITHDLSKFRASEWFPYVRHFYGPDGVAARKSRKHEPGNNSEFDAVWERHWTRNPHHWEHWLFRCGGIEVATSMPERFVREMLADWYGAGRAQGFNDFPDWYWKNRDKIKLHPQTRTLVENLIREYVGLLNPRRRTK